MYYDIFNRLSCCIVEDTFIFVAVGADLWLLLGSRLGVAVIITYFASKILNKIEVNRKSYE